MSDNGDCYDANSIRDDKRSRSIQPVIRMRKSRNKCVGIDHPHYRLLSLVERCFNKRKDALPVATHYDNTAENFLGFVNIPSTRPWLRQLST